MIWTGLLKVLNILGDIGNKCDVAAIMKHPFVSSCTLDHSPVVAIIEQIRTCFSYGLVAEPHLVYVATSNVLEEPVLK